MALSFSAGQGMVELFSKDLVRFLMPSFPDKMLKKLTVAIWFSWLTLPPLTLLLYFHSGFK